MLYDDKDALIRILDALSAELLRERHMQKVKRIESEALRGTSSDTQNAYDGIVGEL
jgi:hypothetical protein